MTLYNQSLLAEDQDFLARTTACVSTQPELGGEDPAMWAYARRWLMAAAPGFADKYSYAIDTGVENPGRVEEVISDTEILAAVQYLLGITDDPEEEEPTP